MEANSWVYLVFQLVALVVVAVGALWAYTRYALERGLLAPATFDVDVVALGSDRADAHDRRVVVAVLTLHNHGTSTLVLTNLRVDLRYLSAGAPIVLGTDPSHPLFGRVLFTGSVRRDVEPAAPAVDRAGGTTGPGRTGRGFRLLEHDTFVQAGVDQTYRFATSVPADARYVLAWGSFEYAQRPDRPQRALLRLSRRLGLIQYSLTHVVEPHTAETVVRLDPGEVPHGS
ncbi:hypothetical protein Cch01nite_07380 [Cellulomonas chitinilytica]|uniref:Uncharacterized protein n=1 Tax=Cellulomonas chitinilytica TaxID=398759 RepID=A0A919P215_9CELL|nr:hypothetical protein [Cellulomonas chitinilytica]GIG20014.1 hypothetical protein Cch01nite_07380 [Cellulomonas chitinilytica]